MWITIATALLSAGILYLISQQRKKPSKVRAFPPLPPGDVLKRGLKKKHLPREADVIVIGAGASGLTLASLLGRGGKKRKVLVLEQHDRAGGGLHSFTENNYEWDTGFHYSGELQPGEALRSIVDALTDGAVDFAPVEDCKVAPGIYDQVDFLCEEDQDDAAPFDVRAGRSEWVRSLKEAFPKDHAAIDAYLADMDEFAKTPLLYAIWRSFTPGSLLERLTRRFMGAPAARFLTVTAAEKLNKLTQNKRLRAILGYVSLGCCGALPEEIAYGWMLGLHTHFNACGASYPVGGSSALARGLVNKIERQGGRVFVRAAVDRVLVDDSGRAAGVRLVKEGIEIRAPVVVSTVGLRETLSGLLRAPSDSGPGRLGSCYSGQGQDGLQDPLSRIQRQLLEQRVSELPYGRGHIYGFVGLKVDDTDEDLQLPKRNVWFLPGHDLREGQENFQKHGATSEAPFGYVGLGFPSEKDPTYAARGLKGKTAAFVCGELPWEWVSKWADTRLHKRGAEYEAFKESFRERMMSLLLRKYPQLQGKIDYVDIGTPLDTNTYLGRLTGASYGIPPTVAKSLAQDDWLRPHMPDFLPEGMFLAGQDVTIDGFAPGLLSSLMCLAALDGPLAWLRIVPMLGGLRGALKVILK